MEFNEYIKLVNNTILNDYPEYLLKQVLKVLEDNKVIVNKKRQSKKEQDTNLIDVSNYEDIKEKINKIIRYNNEALIKAVETVEFKKSYRYTTIFSYDNFQEEILERLISNNQIQYYNENKDSFDKVDFIAKNPTVLKEENKVTFKFSYKKINKEQNKEEIKYIAQAVLFTDINILEVRFDQIRGCFKDEDLFYKNLVLSIKAWIQGFLKINLSEIEFKAIIKKIVKNYNKDEKNAEVIPYTTALAMKDGSKAILDIDSKKKFTVPILGELKLLIKENETQFKKSEEAYNLLMEFIDIIEETSDLPWMRLFWHKEGILIRINHQYYGADFSLFQFYGDLKNTEMMDYVTRYLINYKENS